MCALGSIGSKTLQLDGYLTVWDSSLPARGRRARAGAEFLVDGLWSGLLAAWRCHCGVDTSVSIQLYAFSFGVSVGKCWHLCMRRHPVEFFRGYFG
jgi:hypothetical protein